MPKKCSTVFAYVREENLKHVLESYLAMAFPVLKQHVIQMGTCKRVELALHSVGRQVGNVYMVTNSIILSALGFFLLIKFVLMKSNTVSICFFCMAG